jgi:hypothetical protein
VGPAAGLSGAAARTKLASSADIYPIILETFN